MSHIIGRFVCSEVLAAFIVAFTLCTAWGIEPSLQKLETLFAQPPAETRILKIIHNWPDDPSAQDQIMQSHFEQMGFGGIVSNVHFDQYMESPEHWKAFVRAITEAKKRGLNLWLYDEKGYPSGNAGGLVLRKNPDWAAEGLLTLSLFLPVEKKVELTLPPGKLICAKAIPMQDELPSLEKAIDLSNSISEGKLQVQLSSNYWVVLITRDKIYEGTHADGNLHQKMPYINLLSQQATYEFARLTYENYAAHFGPDLGKWFESTFTDEPSLMSCFLKPMPYGVLPWEENFADIFRQRRGYDLIPLLPLLAVDNGARGPAAQVKYDYWQTVAELVAENYFGQIQEFCARYHIPSGGHLISEESLATHIPFYGSSFASLRRLDSPSIDCLTSLPHQVPWYAAKLAASAAQLNNKRLVMSETSDHSQVWRAQGDNRPKITVSQDEIRGTLGRQIVGGINRFTSYYSWMERSPEQIKELNLWTGRGILLTEGGEQVADIALLYPIESCWARYLPSRIWANESAEVLSISESYHSISQSLWNTGRDFTYIDTQAINESVSSSSGLKHPSGIAWRILILPSTDTLPIQTWKKLEEFVQNGGILIAAGALPKNSSTQYPSPEVLKITDNLFGETPQPITPRFNKAGGTALYLPHGMESLTGKLIDTLLERDFTDLQKNSSLRITHRTYPEHEVYFVFNDSPNSYTGKMKFSACGSPRKWDLNTGTVTLLENNKSIYEHTFSPWNAVVYTFDKQIPRQVHSSPDTLPVYETTLLNLPEPVQGKGEFVHSELTCSGGENSPTEYYSRSTITRSNVDTFLFLSFKQEMNLSGMELLSFEAMNPGPYRTPTQLLVILREADGAEYLASTGFTLNNSHETDYHKIYVPKTNFTLAGWSSDSNHQLDLEKITELRIGWGGYYGTKDEEVHFNIRNIGFRKIQ